MRPISEVHIKLYRTESNYTSTTNTKLIIIDNKKLKNCISCHKLHKQIFLELNNLRDIISIIHGGISSADLVQGSH